MAEAAGFDAGVVDAKFVAAVGGALLKGGYVSAHLRAADAAQRRRRSGGFVPPDVDEVLADIRRAAKGMPRGRRARGSLGPVDVLAQGAWPHLPGGPHHPRACGLVDC